MFIPAGDPQGASVRADRFEFRPVGVVRKVLSRAVVDDLAVEVDERDADVLGDLLDAAAEPLRLAPEDETGCCESHQDEGGGQEVREGAFHGKRR